MLGFYSLIFLKGLVTTSVPEPVGAGTFWPDPEAGAGVKVRLRLTFDEIEGILNDILFLRSNFQH